MAEQLDFFHQRSPLDTLDLVPLSDEFRIWAFFAGNEVLRKVIEPLKMKLNLSDEEALQYLDRITASSEDHNVSYRTDLTSNGTLSLGKKIIPQIAPNYPIEFQYGSVSHAAILMLLRGEIADLGIARQIAMEFPDRQLTLLPNPILNKQLFLPDDLFFFDVLNGKISPNLERELGFCLTEMQKVSDDLSSWASCPQRKRLIEWMLRLLGPLIGQFIHKLPPCKNDLYREYLLALTLQIWAGVIINTFGKNGETDFLFDEVRILPTQEILNGGRADALKVSAINGEKPNKEQRFRLKSLYSFNPKPHVGMLIRSIHDLFGHDVDLELLDLKIAVGDGERATKIIKKQNLLEPISEHLGQMEHYIFLSTVSHHISMCLAGLDSPTREVWENGAPLSKGKLQYLLPGQPSVFHEIVMNPDQQRKEFIERVVFKWIHGKFSATVRRIDRVMTQHFQNQTINGLAGSTKVFSKPAETQVQGHFFPAPSSRQMILSVMDQYRVFVDEYKIIEVVKGKKGSSNFVLSLSKLSNLLESGYSAKGFNWDRGGFIKCLHPGHSDRDPSLYVDLKRGFFKCFSCPTGMGGMLDYSGFNGTATNGGGIIKASNFSSLKLKKLGALVIPEKHYAIMGRAQQILQANFPGSRGEKYLCDKRKINPNLAFQYGAGYGNNNLITGLLEEYSIEDLIGFGFIGFSVAVLKSDPFVVMLSKRCPSSRLEVEKTDKNGNKRLAWPYNVLFGRVTIPLTLLDSDKITNFYGRSAISERKDQKHRKLSTDTTKVPHGGFNMQVIGDDSKEIKMVEGVMDALTLIAYGVKDTIAIIGLRNKMILDFLMNSGKILAVALDNDEKGIIAAREVIEELEKSGVDAYNYTANFIIEHPEAAAFDDYGAWWQKEGYKTNK